MSQPLKETDILFPHLSNTPNLSSTLSSLRRSTLSTHNRLTSIVSDSDFVTSVASAYDLPLVANERCGSWYIPPSRKSGSVYFKSTDGHMGEWSFSLRRLNLQLLDVVANFGGAVVVDSTRRGKSMPDALSKTIPTWCCVINRAVFGTPEKDEMRLFTPPQAVGESEHAQMEKRIDGFVRQFLVRIVSRHTRLYQLISRQGHLQTQHRGPSQQASKATPPNMGDTTIIPSGFTALFH
jgi:tRNA A64-2'-O-ribosylphosphate transferase